MGRVTMNMGLRWDRYHGWMPEQQQIAFTNGPVSVPAQMFPESAFLHLEQHRPAHRRDLRPRQRRQDGHQGELRSVLAQPGSRRERRREPESENKSVTYNWTDRNGDRHFQMGEQVAPTAIDTCRARSSSIRTSRSRTRTTSRCIWNARSRAALARASASSTRRKTTLIGSFNPGRPVSAYTVPFSFLDVGVDGVRQTPAGTTPAAAPPPETIAG